ncbi:DUF72 domain-containing protein [candidate division KSB1 bacterium]|nr:DUF72 domain-containing protein [candidate division KSB1 bacterium]
MENYVHFGTSSWAYEGWIGNVYHQLYADGRLKKDCLQEYWQDGRFSTVGMDLFFYNPPSEVLLQHYASQFPANKNYLACSKVWQEITLYRFPNQAQWGARRGQLNPNFLNAELFERTVLNAHRQVFMAQTGPFIFEFPYIRKDDPPFTTFIAALDQFFSKLPTDFKYSVELRNKNFLHPDYFNVLRKYHVAHVFNQWSYMPAIREQLKFDALTADFLVARILTPSGVAYQDSVKMFEPFNKIIERQPEIRADVLKLAMIAIKERKYAYLLINNRLEGCAPETVRELKAEMESKSVPDSN